MAADLHIVCACCPAPATALFEIFSNGKTLSRDVCQACGDKLQGEMAEMHDALTGLMRDGMDERMALRVIAQRVARKELCPSVPFSDDVPVVA